MNTKELIIIDGQNAVVNNYDVYDLYVISGTVVLTVNWAVTFSGTLYKGLSYDFRYDGECSSAVAAHISILGSQVPDEYLDKNWHANAYYDGASWQVNFYPDFEEEQFIKTDDLKDLSVTTEKINDLVITTGKIVDLAITDPKINDNAILTAKVIDKAITYAKIQDVAANSILCNPTANITVVSELVVGASQIIARLATGDLKACTIDEIQRLLSVQTTALTDANFWIGNASNVATPVIISNNATVSNTGSLVINDSVIESVKTTKTLSGNVIGGIVSMKYLDGANLKALLDSTTNNIFAMKLNSIIVKVECVIQTASGIAGTIDLGPDATLRTAGADQDGFLALADSNVIGRYSSDNNTYTGAQLKFGQFTCEGDGNITIKSSVNLSASNIIGYVAVYYINI